MSESASIEHCNNVVHTGNPGMYVTYAYTLQSNEQTTICIT